MAKIATVDDPRGLKRICMSCGTRFFDLNKRPIVCPKCETEFTGEIKIKSRRGRTAADDTTEDDQISEATEADEDEDDVLEADEAESDTVSLEDVEEMDDDDTDEDEIDTDLGDDDLDADLDDLDEDDDDDLDVEIEDEDK